jgi:hypothetical protein
MRLASLSTPLEGLRLYHALLGLVHTTSSTGGFDLTSLVNFDFRSGFFELFLDLFGVILGDVIFDGLGRAVNKFFGFF